MASMNGEHHGGNAVGSSGPEPGAASGGWWSRDRIVLIGFLAVAAFYLLTEHRAHLYGALPWLLLAACPLMHLFMHGGHGSHRGGPRSDETKGAAVDALHRHNQGDRQ
jgi:hypothetical protein